MAEEDGHIVVRHEKANYGPRATDVRLVRSGAILRPVGEHAIDPAAGMRCDMELAAVLRQVRQVRSGLNKAHPAQARQVLRWGYRGERARAYIARLRCRNAR
ncbi:MAG: hypothetical protein EBR82_73210 [Caulobacteraceae bacterium]|nr:hypothetical protein [Caulobacteraceae bacterium]